MKRVYEMFTQYGENKAPYEDLRKEGYLPCRCNYYGGTLYTNNNNKSALLKADGASEKIIVKYYDFIL